jgi:hypothetical protein
LKARVGQPAALKRTTSVTTSVVFFDIAGLRQRLARHEFDGEKSADSNG